MQAIQYDFSIPKYLVTKGIGGRWPGAYTNRRTSPVVLREVDSPDLPGPEWLAIEPILSGVCGTDLGTIAGKTSPALAPFASFPATLGHEVVGRVVEVGPDVDGIAVGDRVVVDPWISCEVRGLPVCPACERGRPYLCRKAAEGPFGPGMLMGFCRGLHGGWSERMVIHRSQAYRVPKGVNDDTAVLIEPLSVALHGVLRAVEAVNCANRLTVEEEATRPKCSQGTGHVSLNEGADVDPQLAATLWTEEGSTEGAGLHVLVIGAGTIGLMTVAAIRLLQLPWHVTVLARHGVQQELALGFGADEVLPAGAEGALRAAERGTGARRYKPPIGRPVLTGGFDLVFDCVGSSRSIDDALRVAKERATVVVLGGAGQLKAVDWTFVWMRELKVIGSCGSGLEERCGMHTFELAFQLLGVSREIPLERMITHRYRLSDYREALRCSFDRRKSGAVKVVFAIGGYGERQ